MIKSYSQAGFSIECGANKVATLGECGGVTALLGGAFSVIGDFFFDNEKENKFLNGAGSGTHSVYFGRNIGSSNDDSISFSAIDASGDERTIKWAGVSPARSWQQLAFVSVDDGLGGLTMALYINAVLAAQTSETLDGTFSVAEVYDLMLGSSSLAAADTKVAGALNFYDRDLTEAELLAAFEKRSYPVDFIKSFPLSFPHRGLAEELPTYA